MHNGSDFADLLRFYVNKTGYTTGQLSKRSGVPKPTIVNWIEGRVRRPRSWRDLARLAQALHLRQAQTTKLLKCAGHPALQELFAKAQKNENTTETELLSEWFRREDPTRQRNRLYFFDNMAQQRMRAEDWKKLHNDCQVITFKLLLIRGAISRDHIDFALDVLELQWRMECSDLIKRFMRLEHLPNRYVRKQFVKTSLCNTWLDRLKQDTDNLDLLVDQCTWPEQLQHSMKKINMTLYSLERTSNELLRFFDDKLLKTLGELEHEIEDARRYFMES